MPERTLDSASAAPESQRRIIGVLTTSRADSGISRWIVDDMQHSRHLQPMVLWLGDSLPLEYPGQRAEADTTGGVRVPVVGRLVLSRGDQPAQVASWVAECMATATELLEANPVSVLLVVGDRIEVLAIAEAAAIMGIPIAHVHGGETSFGALDERCRHAITKLADVHFVATPDYGERVVQLGENRERVFVVGSPGLCAIERVGLAPRSEVEEVLGLPMDCRYFMVTFHPVTTEPMESIRDLKGLLEALSGYPNHYVVFTGVNADPGNAEIARVINAYASSRNNCIFAMNLGHQNYLAALKYADACIGNSSSGLIEAPALRTPTLNVGGRQAGRMRATSIFDVSSAQGNIAHGLALAVSARENGYSDPNPPYGSGGASAAIVDILENLVLPPHAAKIFADSPRNVLEAGINVPA